MVKFLIGSKVDVDSEKRVISFDAGKELAEKYKMEFFEVSAKSDLESVNNLF